MEQSTMVNGRIKKWMALAFYIWQAEISTKGILNVELNTASEF
jgi:hypothetical protein